MIVCVPVTPSDQIDPRWGRAAHVAVVDVQGGELTRWRTFDVKWDELHDTGSEGGHHARIARFLLEHGVQVVIAHHMGDPMAQMLEQMAIEVHLGASGDARRAVLGVARTRSD